MTDAEPKPGDGGKNSGPSLPPLQRALAAPFTLLVGFYRRFISPLKPPMCRFEPSCSAYAQEALRTHALPRALLLTIWRLLRCQPLCCGGYDPVPPRKAPPHRDAS